MAKGTRQGRRLGRGPRNAQPPTPAPTRFDLNDLTPWGTISAGMRDALLEAARVVLDRHHGGGSASGTWTHNTAPQTVAVAWLPATQAIKTTHANDKDATEDGAYAIAVYAARHLGYNVLGRAPQGTGADWYMAHPSAPLAMLKLEVSGIETGGSPGHRLAAKVDQGKGGSVRLPGVAVVFRFSDVGCYSESWP